MFGTLQRHIKETLWITDMLHVSCSMCMMMVMPFARIQGFVRVLFQSTIWHNKATMRAKRESEEQRERDAWRNMAVSICYIFPSPPTQKPPVPSVPLWGAGESVPVPAATKPSSASWSPGTDTYGKGRKGGHLDGDLTREAKMAGLAHEMWTEPGGFTLCRKLMGNRLIMHPERTMEASST